MKKCEKYLTAGPAEIRVAGTAGFCFGVNRAVELVDRLLEEGKKVCTLGPIIHNPQLVEKLSRKGVRIVHSPEEAPEGYTLVIRSHGVPKSVLNRAGELGIPVENATCPFVLKIHKIVEQQSSAGKIILIAGNPDHPEVQGIAGHAQGESFVFSSPQALELLLRENRELCQKSLCAVAQTTFSLNLWKKSRIILKNHCTNAEIFDTICDATAERQREAQELSAWADRMLVIGGRSSSNTAKLKDVCEENARTSLVETGAELCAEWLSGAQRIGVTAGASTPSSIIKEVVKSMSEILNEGAMAAQAENEEAVETVEQAAEAVPEKSFDEMSFEEALEASLNNLNTDQRVKGVVLSVGPTEVQVDIGRKHAGYIPANELSNDPNANPEDLVKVGDVLDLIVMRTNDQEGVVTLSKRRYDAMLGWEKIVAAKEENTVLEGVVTEIIKGGLLVISHGSRVFIPASQATAFRGDPLEDLLGKTVQFRVLEINRGRRVVGSIRSVLRDQRKAMSEELWKTIAVGNHYTGRVKSLTSYGAFVDIGGVDGMVHISELSWQRIKHPSEVVNVGDTIEVTVKDVDFEKKKISLTYKKAEDNPWEILKRDYNVGDVVDAVIVSMTTYGAFARVIPGIDGLIHISQIADHHVEKPSDELKIGEEVKVKIIEIDFDRKRVSLSIRALKEADAPAEEEEGEDQQAEEPQE